MKNRIIKLTAIFMCILFAAILPSQVMADTPAVTDVISVPKAQKPTLSTAKQKQISVYITEIAGADGYEIRYSENKNFKKKKTVSVGKTDGLYVNINKLKNDTTYYVSVRGYIKQNTKKQYGEWSKTAKIKVKSSAARADLPNEMLESYIIDAMDYVGFKVERQKKRGAILQDFASGPRTPMSDRSGIKYSGIPSGRETVKDKSTYTGKAPNLKKFRQYGLCCAGFCSYYFLNYLPNIAGVDTSALAKAMKKSGMPSQSCDSWSYAAKLLVKQGKAKVVDKVKRGQSFPAAHPSKLKIGDLITFSIPNMGEECGHVAVYAGTNGDGDHFVAHVGSDEGPVFQTLERFENVVNDHDGCAYSIVYRFTDIPTSKYDYKVKLNKTKFKYTGKAIKPTVTAYDTTGKAISPENYTVYYKSNKKVGNGKAIVVFKNGYKYVKTVKFKITK